MSVHTTNEIHNALIKNNLPELIHKLEFIRDELIVILDLDTFGSDRLSISFIEANVTYQSRLEDFLILTRKFIRNWKGK